MSRILSRDDAVRLVADERSRGRRIVFTNGVFDILHPGHVRYLTEAQIGTTGGGLQFAINTYGRRAHPAYPAGFEVDIDTNGDGVVDYFVFNGENGAFASTGQTLAYVQRVGAASASAFFFADADLNSGNMILTVPMSALGLAPGTTIGFSVYAADNYFSGITSDAIEGMKFTPGNERFGLVGDSFNTVAPRSATEVAVRIAAVPNTASSERGLLLMYRSNAGLEADAIRIR